MLALLSVLRHKCAIGFVGGSNLVKKQGQLGTSSNPHHVPLRLLFRGERIDCLPDGGTFGGKLVHHVVRGR